MPHPPPTTPWPSRHRGTATMPRAPMPVCDGCGRVGAIGPWHPGDDGAQFCDACHAATVFDAVMLRSRPRPRDASRP